MLQHTWIFNIYMHFFCNAKKPFSFMWSSLYSYSSFKIISFIVLMSSPFKSVWNTRYCKLRNSLSVILPSKSLSKIRKILVIAFLNFGVSYLLFKSYNGANG